jgi:ATP-dependent HslUV protease subunit HslV
MTTIATDGHQIVADTLQVWGTERSLRPASKMVVRNNAIYALAGTYGILNELIEWVESGARYKDVPFPTLDGKWTLLVLKRGSIWQVSSDLPGLLQEGGFPFSVGSGGEFALGAMHAGATPLEAVRIASKLDVYTGGPLDVLWIEQVTGFKPVTSAPTKQVYAKEDENHAAKTPGRTKQPRRNSKTHRGEA